MMDYQKLIKRTLVFAGLLIVAACAAPPAYVHNGSEFDRESYVYLNGITSRSQVVICYHKNGTTPQQVADLAIKECAQFSKQAVFLKQSLRVCPLVTPIAATYECAESALNGTLNSFYN